MTANQLFQRTGSAEFPAHLKCLISGPPKSGKTTLVSTVPNVIVLDTEPWANNLESIAHLDIPFVTITNSQDLKQVAFMLGNETLRKQVAASYGMDDIGGVAIDTLDSLQKLLKQERIREMHRREFQRDDWGWLKTEMEEIINSFNQLPMHVLYAVHLKSKELGKGEEKYQQISVGLEGAIAESVAGMVGYSLLTFRKPVLQPDGSTRTEYYVRAEGDEVYDFLGTRTAGRLPAVISPDMSNIYNAVMEGRKQALASREAPPPVQPIDVPAAIAEVQQQAPQPPAQQPAQNPGQQAPPMSPQDPTATQPPVQQPGEAPKPADEEPINAAALAATSKMYQALNIPFPEDKFRALTIGQARQVNTMWRAAQTDHAEGKGPEGSTPITVMIDILRNMNLLPDEGQAQPAPAAPAEAKRDGTIKEVEAYIAPNGETDLARVQEVYDLETAKDSPRTSLVTKLESLGARPKDADNVQPPVQSQPAQEPPQQPAEPVTQPTPQADAPSTGAAQDEQQQAVQAVQQSIPAEVTTEGVTPGAPCAVCGNPHDDKDLAELALMRFQKVLCIKDYLAASQAS